jgi:hypothetical protein
MNTTKKIFLCFFYILSIIGIALIIFDIFFISDTIIMKSLMGIGMLVLLYMSYDLYKGVKQHEFDK